MSRFAILLGGDLRLTNRLRHQIAGARFIAADSGMRHAHSLGVIPELWVGDFDSSGSELTQQFSGVQRQIYPIEKDATDGEIAINEAIKRGASEIILLGGFGGQMDHALAHLTLALALAKKGLVCFVTSGTEEGWPLLKSLEIKDFHPETRISILPLSDLEALTIKGVYWPLHERSVKLGETLTLSNRSAGPISLQLASGAAIVLAYPEGNL